MMWSMTPDSRAHSTHTPVRSAATRHHVSPIARAFGSDLAPAALLLAFAIALQPWTYIGIAEGQSGSFWYAWRSLIIFGASAIAFVMLLTHARAILPRLKSAPILAHAILLVGTAIGTLLSLPNSSGEQAMIGLMQSGWGWYAILATFLITVTIYLAAGESPKARRWILALVTSSALAQAALALVQAFTGVDPLSTLHGGQVVSLVHGSSARDDYLALLLTPFVLLLLHAARSRDWRAPKALVAIAGLAIVSIAINATNNRAALVALAVALLFYLASGAWQHRRALILALTSAALLVVPLPTPASAVAGKEAGTTAVDTNLTTLRTRLIVWEGAIKNLHRLPASGLFGLGPVGFALAHRDYVDLNDFVGAYNIEHKKGLEDPIFVRIVPNPEPAWSAIIIAERAAPENEQVVGMGFAQPHNTLIDLLYQGGPLAAIAWLVLFLGGALHALRNGRPHYAAALLAAVIAYQALFPLSFVDPTMYALAALAWATPRRQPKVATA
jgi:O-antigen ligase